MGVVIIYEEKTKLQSIPVRRKAISVMQGMEVSVVRLTPEKKRLIRTPHTNDIPYFAKKVHKRGATEVASPVSKLSLPSVFL
jgi:hypothetical protein